jgi:hypothetical protein
MEHMQLQLVRRLSILALFLSLARLATALTVGLAPAEDQSFTRPSDGQASPIGYLVSGALNALYEAGYIGTDAAVSRRALEAWGPVDYGLAEAREGAVDCVIALYVEWAKSELHKDSFLASTVHYRLVRARDGALLGEGGVPGPADTEDSSTHEARSASQAGSSAVKACLSELSLLSKGGQ